MRHGAPTPRRAAMRSLYHDGWKQPPPGQVRRASVGGRVPPRPAARSTHPDSENAILDATPAADVPACPQLPSSPAAFAGASHTRSAAGAVVQGGEGPWRRGQLIAWRAKRPVRPGNATASGARLRHAYAPKRSARKPGASPALTPQTMLIAAPSLLLDPRTRYPSGVGRLFGWGAPRRKLLIRHESRSPSRRRNAPACGSEGASRRGCRPRTRSRRFPDGPAAGCRATGR